MDEVESYFFKCLDTELFEESCVQPTSLEGLRFRRLKVKNSNIIFSLKYRMFGFVDDCDDSDYKTTLFISTGCLISKEDVSEDIKERVIFNIDLFSN